MELNKIYHGDCKLLIKDLPDKSVDCIVTDPPYEMVMGGVAALKIGIIGKKSQITT